MEPKKRSISKAEVNALPLWRYEGQIVLLDSQAGVAEAAERLAATTLIGIDTETRPAFRKGVSYPVALLQLALPDIVYLVRLNNIGLPDSIRAVMESEDIKKVGIAPRDDIAELRRDFDCEPRGIIALEQICRQRGYTVSSARKLTALILGHRISKSQQTSNWAQPKLTGAQQAYAATDAWICQAIYRHLHPER
ncbi:MAG: ribonuclease D [Myxococcota bacterium]|jgi:ribonuclease D